MQEDTTNPLARVIAFCFGLYGYVFDGCMVAGIVTLVVCFAGYSRTYAVCLDDPRAGLLVSARYYFFGNFSISLSYLNNSVL